MTLINRLNKILSVLVLLTSFFTFKTFALGSGVQIGGLPSFNISENGVSFSDFEGNLTGTIKLFRLPAAFGFGLEAGLENKDFMFGLSGFFDYWALDLQLENTWNLYSGFGIFGKIMMNTVSDFTGTLAARFFIGSNLLFYDNFLEYYWQVNVQPGYEKSFTENSKAAFKLFLPLETGVRFHF